MRVLLPAELCSNLVAGWLPPLDSVVGKLTAGAQVVDMGCGHGESTALIRTV